LRRFSQQTRREGIHVPIGEYRGFGAYRKDRLEHQQEKLMALPDAAIGMFAAR
jgi:predicted alpha/beta hydrolase